MITRPATPKINSGNRYSPGPKILLFNGQIRGMSDEKKKSNDVAVG